MPFEFAVTGLEDDQVLDAAANEDAQRSGTRRAAVDHDLCRVSHVFTPGAAAASINYLGCAHVAAVALECSRVGRDAD